MSKGHGTIELTFKTRRAGASENIKYVDPFNFDIVTTQTLEHMKNLLYENFTPNLPISSPGPATIKLHIWVRRDDEDINEWLKYVIAYRLRNHQHIRSTHGISTARAMVNQNVPGARTQSARRYWRVRIPHHGIYMESLSTKIISGDRDDDHIGDDDSGYNSDSDPTDSADQDQSRKIKMFL